MLLKLSRGFICSPESYGCRTSSPCVSAIDTCSSETGCKVLKNQCVTQKSIDDAKKSSSLPNHRNSGVIALLTALLFVNQILHHDPEISGLINKRD